MKKKLQFIMPALMALVLIFTFTACPPAGKGDGEEIMDPPPRVQNFNCADAANGQAMFTWNPALDASSYKFFYAEVDAEYPSAPHAAVTATSYNLTGLTNGVTYKAFVVATNRAGDASPSNEEIFTPEERDYSVVFPKVDFENIAIGPFSGSPHWSTRIGVIGFSQAGLIHAIELNPDAKGNNSNQVLGLQMIDQAGARAVQLNFTNATDSVTSSKTRHGIAFDWYPGIPLTEFGYLAIQDGTIFNGSAAPLDNQFIAFYVMPDLPPGRPEAAAATAKLMYKVGNASAGQDIGGEEARANILATAIDTGINICDKWYHVEVIIDTDASTIDVTITDSETGGLAFENTHIPYGQGYNPKIASIRFFANRWPQVNNTWYSYIDNLELFRSEIDSPTIEDPPLAVTDFEFIGRDSGQASFSWSAAQYATGYKLFYAKINEEYPASYVLLPRTPTSYTLTGLEDGVIYKAYIVATNLIGDSDDSNEVEFSPTGLPEIVTNVEWIDAANGAAVLTWYAAARADSYKVFHRTASGAYPASPTVIINAVDNTEKYTYTITGLSNGTAYRAMVVASNTAGDAAPSGEVIFTPVALGYIRVFPKVHFENIPVGDFTGTPYWTSLTGTVRGTGEMNQSVQNNPVKNENSNNSDRVLRFDVFNQGGARAVQLNFSNATDTVGSGTKHGIAFDWYPGTPSSGGNGYLGIQDGTSAVFGNSGEIMDNQFIAFYVTSDSRLTYRVGNVSLVGAETGQDIGNINHDTDLISLDIGGANLNKWYRVAVVIDTSSKTIAFIISDLETGLISFTQSNIPFAAGVAYNDKIASIRVSSYRRTANVNWNTYVDNLELFRGDYALIPPPPNPPPAVTNLVCSDASDGQAVFTWPAAARATGYKFFYAQVGADYPAQPHETVTSTGFTLTGLTNGTEYKARVVAYNSGGEANYSNEVTFTPQVPHTVPNAVTDLAFTRATKGEAVLVWSTVTGAAGYKLFYAEAGASYPGEPQETLISADFTLRGLANGTTYKAKVVAYNSAGDAGDSNEVEFTPVETTYVHVFPKIDFEDGALQNMTAHEGTIGGVGALTQLVMGNPFSSGNIGGRILRVEGINQSGNRGTQFNFSGATNTVSSSFSRHGIAFDWYPAADLVNANGYLGIQDGTDASLGNSGNRLNNQFIAFYVTPDGKIKYRVGNFPAGQEVAINPPDLVDTGLNTGGNRWYHITVIIDTALEIIDVAITDLETGEIAFEENYIPFAKGVTYNPRIASIRFFGARLPAADNFNWTTYIDNIELFRDEIVTPAPVKAPAAVTDLVCTGVASGEASFTWSRTYRATGYKFFYAEAGAEYPSSPNVTQATVDIKITGLVNGTGYKAKVVAYNNIGDALGSDEVTFTPKAEPDAVTNFACIDEDDGQAVFVWSATARATGYKFFYAEAGAAYSALPHTTVTTTGYTLTDLTNGVTYKAKIVATNGDGDAGDSNEVTFTPVGPDYTRVFPKVDFEDIAVGNFTGGAYWTTQIGNLVNAAGMDQMIQANPNKTGNMSDQVLMFRSVGQSAQRATQLNFISASDTISGGSRHGIAFDWHPGEASPNNGVISIQDGTSYTGTTTGPLDNQFISLFVVRDNASTYRIMYRVGNAPAGIDVGVATNTDHPAGVVDTGIDVSVASKNKWYRVEIVIDTDAKTIDLKIIDLVTNNAAFTQNNMPFAAGVTYNPRIASMRFFGARNSGNLNWTTYIDNLELFRY